MSTPTPKKFSPVRKCEHCGNRAPMEEVGGFNDVKSHYDEDSAQGWEEGWVFTLLRCPACDNIVLQRYYWHDVYDPGDITPETVYPVESSAPDGLPEKIAKAFDAARRVRAIDANAYGVLIGRLLDMVCADRGAKGDTLAKRLEDLAKKGEIPGRLSDVASGLRKLRNVGAHADLGELTEEDVPLLDDLSTAILEYVYSAPMLVQRAEARLRKLTASDAASGGTDVSSKAEGTG